MSARLRSDFWVSAHLRRCAAAGVAATLLRRGAAEAGAIFVRLDLMDGAARLFGPAPQVFAADADDGERLFSEIALAEPTPAGAWEKLQRELRFDPDIWIIDIDDREGRHFLPLAREPGGVDS